MERLSRVPHTNPARTYNVDATTIPIVFGVGEKGAKAAGRPSAEITTGA